jgi:hypothetical protein
MAPIRVANPPRFVIVLIDLMVAKVAQSAQSVKRINGFLSHYGALNCGTGSKRRGLSAGLAFFAARRLWDFFLSVLWRTGEFTVTTAESVWVSKAWSVTASVPATGALPRLVRINSVVASITAISNSTTMVPRRSRLVMSSNRFIRSVFLFKRKNTLIRSIIGNHRPSF